MTDFKTTLCGAIKRDGTTFISIWSFRSSQKQGASLDRWLALRSPPALAQSHSSLACYALKGQWSKLFKSLNCFSLSVCLGCTWPGGLVTSWGGSARKNKYWTAITKHGATKKHRLQISIVWGQNLHPSNQNACKCVWQKEIKLTSLTTWKKKFYLNCNFRQTKIKKTIC